MKRFLFYGVVLLQVFFLVAMSVSYYLIDDFGTIIKLKTAPVDPSDPFYGDYVTLNYEAQMIPEEKWQGEKEPSYGSPVYVLLAPNNQGIYQVKAASNEKIAVSREEVLLKARFRGHWSGRYRVNFGLDRYFVEDNTGQQYEQQRNNMIVKVAVAPWGQKKIVSLEPIE